MITLATINKADDKIKNNPLFPILSTMNPKNGVIPAADKQIMVKNYPAVSLSIPYKVFYKSFALAVKEKQAPYITIQFIVINQYKIPKFLISSNLIYSS